MGNAWELLIKIRISWELDLVDETKSFSPWSCWLKWVQGESAALGKAPKKGTGSILIELPHQQVQHVPGRNIFAPKTNSWFLAKWWETAWSWLLTILFQLLPILWAQERQLQIPYLLIHFRRYTFWSNSVFTYVNNFKICIFSLATHKRKMQKWFYQLHNAMEAGGLSHLGQYFNRSSARSWFLINT